MVIFHLPRSACAPPLAQVTVADDVVARKDRSRLVLRHLHGDALRDVIAREFRTAPPATRHARAFLLVRRRPFHKLDDG